MVIEKTREDPGGQCLAGGRVPTEVERAVVSLALEQPASGQARVADELRKRALTISPAGVRCVWARHNLQTMHKRLNVLQAFQKGSVVMQANALVSVYPDSDGMRHSPLADEGAGTLPDQTTTPDRRLSD